MIRTDNPYLSVVVTTRNDDHGGDPLKRLQAFVNTFDAQCRRTTLAAEVVVVEWNPPSDRPRLYDLIRMPPHCAFALRFIEVPPALHGRLPHADVLPLFQMIGKNVGIRRARGRFILSTNIDIIFSNELVEFLASGQLDAACHYRVNRHDIESDFPIDASLGEQMAYCETHQLRLHTRSGTHRVDAQGHIVPLEPDIVGSGGIALGDGWHTREGDPGSGLYRWASREARLTIDRPAIQDLSQGAQLEIEVEPNPYERDSWVELEIRDGERRLVHTRLSARTSIRIPLDGREAPHEITMRMLDASGGRETLPLLERRETLCYRVYRVAVRGLANYPYDMGLWRPATNSANLSMTQTRDGLDVTTDSGRYSYCARYAPFETAEDRHCEFQFEYSRIQGNFALNVMDDVRQCWLPSTVTEIDEGDISVRILTIDVPRHTRFSLYISNNRPNGDQASRFVLRSVAGSVPLDQLIRRSEIVRLRGQERRIGGARRVLWGLGRRIKALVSSFALRKARERFESRIVDDSDRVRDLNDRLASLSSLAELAPIEQLLRRHRPAELHQNASGDFQLLAREHWFELRGFAEFPMYSMNIDGLFETVAHYAGLKEQVLETPLCAYHLEHEKGSGWTPEGEALLKQRIAASGITWLDASAVQVWSSYMEWLQRPMIFNGSDWGFGDVALPERTLQTVVRP
jgi:hypothetical protein